MEPGKGSRETTLWRLGRHAWAILGIVGVLVVLGIAVDALKLVVIPLVLALFPAALLMPAAQWLKRRLRLPPSLAALLTMLGAMALVAGLFAALAPAVRSEVPELTRSLGEGIRTLEDWLAGDPLGIGLEFEGFRQIMERARDQVGKLGSGVGMDVAGSALTAATMLLEGLAAFLLLLVALFFYLKDDGRLARGVICLLPRPWHRHATALADRFWTTTGRYFRGQLLIALVDAVFIGVGLLVLGVPLAIPLAVLVFFGGLLPIVGAVLSGSFAVLVALADAGPLTALGVLALVIAVQQAEGNILEPLILSRVIRLHPLVVVVSIAAGAVLIGVLGAFLAVPIAASAARALEYVRGEEDPDLVDDAAEDPDELADAEG